VCADSGVPAQGFDTPGHSIIIIIIIILAHQHKACRQLKIKKETTAVGD